MGFRPNKKEDKEYKINLAEKEESWMVQQR